MNDETTNRTRTPVDGNQSISPILEQLGGSLDADICEYLVQEGNELIVQESTAPKSSNARSSYELYRSIPGMAQRSGEPWVVDDQYDVRSATASGSGSSEDLNRHRSLVCIPISTEGQILAKAAPPEAFSQDDLAAGEQIVKQLGTCGDSGGLGGMRATDGGRESNRSQSEILEEVADMLSHDLKNHLTVASGNLELAEESGNQEYLENVEVSLQRMLSLVEEVVFLAETGRLIKEKQPVELRDVAVDAWARVPSEEASLDIVDDLTLMASTRGLEHLLENLLDNAITHGGPGVRVEMGPLDDGFYVEDDGPGIPKEQREQVFERGYSASEKSTGLGLHIADLIADAHGWVIDVADSAIGGARFEITGAREAANE